MEGEEKKREIFKGSINQATICGVVCAIPKLYSTPSGVEYTTVIIRTFRRPGAGGDAPKKYDDIHCRIYGEMAHAACHDLEVGVCVVISGVIRAEKYITSAGEIVFRNYLAAGDYAVKARGGI